MQNLSFPLKKLLFICLQSGKYILTAVLNIVGNRFNFPGGGKCHSGKLGTHKFINQHRKEGDISDKTAHFTQLHGKGAHSESNTCLRQKCYA